MHGYDPQPGDIMACYGTDFASRFISLVTAWPLSPRGLFFGPSHVAIVAKRYLSIDRLYWYESTTKCRHKCEFSGEDDNGVQVHKIRQRVEDYTSRGGKVVVYRLVRPLESYEAAIIEDELFYMLEQQDQYNMYGALSSGGRILRWLFNQFGWARRTHIYCSHMLARLLSLKDVERLRLTSNDHPNRYTPGKLLRVLVRAGIYEEHVTL